VRLILLGPPGSGKGTQAKRLAQDTGIIHLATGDLFRSAMSAGTPLGRTAREYISRGNLVPDDIVNGMVREWLGQHQGIQFVFDGYPRTDQQAVALESMTRELSMPLDVAIDIKVPDEVIVSRAVGRLVCSNCGAIYHLTSKPPKLMGVCDICRGVLEVREDDQPSTVRHRLTVYHRITEPVRQFYAVRGILKEIDGVGSPDEVYGRLRSLVDV
jgi:adenylate kinase